jgi:hypothetical protein
MRMVTAWRIVVIVACCALCAWGSRHRFADGANAERRLGCPSNPASLAEPALPEGARS